LSYFIKHFLDGACISMVMLLHRIIHLQATIEESNEVRRVKLKRNDKDPEMMRTLSFALEKLNRLRIQGPRGKYMEFFLV